MNILKSIHIHIQTKTDFRFQILGQRVFNVFNKSQTRFVFNSFIDFVTKSHSSMAVTLIILILIEWIVKCFPSFDHASHQHFWRACFNLCVFFFSFFICILFLLFQLNIIVIFFIHSFVHSFKSWLLFYAATTHIWISARNEQNV